MQSRANSAVESCVNMLVGYFVAVLSQIVIFPWFNIHVAVHENFVIAGWFTVTSIIRSYLLRRYFTKRTEHEQP